MIVFSVWIGLILQADEAALTLTELSGRPTGFGETEVERWSSSLLASLGLLGGYLVLLALRRRMPRLASPAILWLHVVSQLWLLQPLISTDSTTAYRDPPPALDYVRLDERVGPRLQLKICLRSRRSAGTIPTLVCCGSRGELSQNCSPFPECAGACPTPLTPRPMALIRSGYMPGTRPFAISTMRARFVCWRSPVSTFCW